MFHSHLDEDENNAKVWNLLGICLTKLEQHEDAITCFENALILDPDNDTYIQNKRKCKHKISKKVLDRVTSIPKKKNETPPIHYSPPANCHIPKSKILYFFLGLFALYLILGVNGSYSIGSGSEFLSFLSEVGIIF
ncbi:MAG: tetratricopeptide repeat protein [Methanospirillum hungatei]|nr:tetratricopeptide repeat protein [Methanospirillum hungatei]